MNSMMPKGVEHLLSELFRGQMFVVMNSMMPKGVEHLWLPLASQPSDRCDEFDDAERR